MSVVMTCSNWAPPPTFYHLPIIHGLTNPSREGLSH
jgi:hypothetical protein